MFQLRLRKFVALVAIALPFASSLFDVPAAKATEQAEELYTQAQAQALAGDGELALAALQKALGAGLEGGAQRFLLDSSFDALRGDRLFRGLARSSASEGMLRIAADDEPGHRLIIRGQILDSKGEPTSAIVYMYQADASGIYSEAAPTVEASARLFGYARSDAEGHFVFVTVRPGPAPEREDLEGAARLAPERLHFETTHWDGRSYAHLILFQDDPRMSHPRWQGWARQNDVPLVLITESSEGVQNCSVILRVK